jgi:hypothetical protein
MVYKKYIKRDGKIFGPYYYKSKKKDGKVITEYVGTSAKQIKKDEAWSNSFDKEKNKHKNVFLSLILIGFIFLIGFSLINFNLTGNVGLDIEESYVSGESLQGSLNLILEENEFLPASSVVLLEFGGESYEYNLNELVDQEVVEGEFYVSGFNFSGSGKGYGFSDEEVDFVLGIYSGVESNENEQGGKEEEVDLDSEDSEEVVVDLNETDVEDVREEEEDEEEEINEEDENEEEDLSEESESDEDEEEDILGDTEEVESSESPESESSSESEESSESSSESDEDESSESPLTGDVIKNIFGGIGYFFLTLTGQVSLELQEEVSGSVSVGEDFSYELKEGQTAKIKDGSVSSGKDSDVKLKTKDNQVVVELKKINDERLIEINLTELDLKAQEGELKISLVYENTTLVYESSLIEVLEIIQDGLIETVSSQVVVGRPVKWKKTINVNEINQIKIEIPESASKVIVKEIETNEFVEANVVDGEKVEATITGNFLKNLVGRVIGEDELEIEQQTKEVVIEQDIVERDLIEENNETELEIEYETPGPVAFESEVSSGKQIVISSEVHYENILAYAELPYPVPESEIRLYGYVNGSKVLMDFESYSLEDEISIEEVVESLNLTKESNESLSLEDSEIFNESLVEKEVLVNYIEWIVPHLSNQTYELIIEITKADHLDSDRNFVSDIYDSVKTQDGNWSERINSSEYVRVTFEQMLDNEKDITVYARGSGSIEVYEFGEDDLIVSFPEINSEGLYKVYLTELNGTQDVFDLKIVGDYLEFDWIVDPSGNSTNDCWDATPDADSYHPLCSCDDLQNMSTQLTWNYSLQNNVDFSECASYIVGAGFVPVGDVSTYYTGHFQGNHYVLSNFVINSSATSYVGLFGAARKNISNVGFIDVNVTGDINTGSLVGYLNCIAPLCYLENSYVDGGEIIGVGGATGGLVGNTNEKAIIENSYARNVTVISSTYAGGLLGAGQAKVINSYATGSVTGDGAGGLIGLLNVGGTANNSWSTSTLSGTTYEGGLIGRFISATITNSYWFSGTSNCYEGGDTGCTKASGITDFYDIAYDVYDSTEPTWDFTDLWKDSNNGTGYPPLVGPVGSDCWDAVEDPHPICSCVDLQNMSAQLAWDYYLNNDVDCSGTTGWNAGAGFEAVGTFTGSLNGNNYTVSDLFTDNAGATYVGLFGYVNGGEIYDMILSNVNFSGGTDDAGGLAGYINNAGKIKNVNISGYVNGPQATGGLTGKLSATALENCHTSVDANSTNNVGGLIGNVLNSVVNITDCSASGLVNGTGSNIGGLIGISTVSTYANFKLYDSFATGNVSGISTSIDIGGLIGEIDEGFINNSYATGNVIEGDDDLGGLIGIVTNGAILNIDHCYATGDILAPSGDNYRGGLIGYYQDNGNLTNSWASGNIEEGLVGASIGGLVGYAQGNLYFDNCSFSGNVSALTSASVGGLIGLNQGKLINNSHTTGNVYAAGNVGGLIGNSRESLIENSYSTGFINGTGSNIGGLLGYLDNYLINITNCYSTSNVNGSGDNIGGFIGGTNGKEKLILDSYATGNVNGVLTTSDYVGGFVGLMCLSQINNSYATGNVTSLGGQGTGGFMAGNVNGNRVNLDNVSATGIVNGSGNYVGGLIAEYQDVGNLTNSHATGDVYIYGGNSAGGLIGYSQSGVGVKNCNATGNIYGGSSSNIGGLIGYNQLNLLNQSFATGNVTTTGNSAGGLIGTSRASEIHESYSTGFVTGTDNVGGFAGYLDAYVITIKDCYSSSNVTGLDDYVGGFIGLTANDPTDLIKIDNCYSSGNISGDANIGGFIGYSQPGTLINHSYATGTFTGNSIFGGFAGDNDGTIENSYYHNSTENPDVCISTGSGTTDCYGILTLNYFKSDVYPGNFPVVNWSFFDIWQERIGDFPSLTWQALGGDYDLTAPNITEMSPSNNTITAETETNFSANLTDVGGLSNATLYIYNASGDLFNSSFIGIIGAPIATTVSIVVTLVEGVYTWFWEVYDVAVNVITSQNESTVPGGNSTLTIALPFSIEVNLPSNNSNFKTTSVEFNVSSGNDLDWCGLSIDGETNLTMTSFNVTYFNFTNATMSEGFHNFTFSCNKSNNLFSSVSGYDILVDTTIPHINFSLPTPDNASTNSGDSIYINVSTNDTNEMSVFVDFNNNLLGWWSFDSLNASGDPYDNSSYGNDGYIYGDVVPTTVGARGDGFEFGGTKDGVVLGNDSSLNNLDVFTVCSWIYPTSFPTQYPMVLCKQGGNVGWDFYITNTGNFGTSFENTTGSLVYIQSSSFGGITLNNWHFICGIQNGTDSTNMKLYHNGVDIWGPFSGVDSPRADDSANPLIIGVQPTLLFEFGGTIDEAILFNRVLSPDEIVALYNATSKTSYRNNFTSLVDGDHNFTAYAVDQSGNVNLTDMRTITLDSIFPLISIDSPLNNSGANADSFNVSVSITETNLDSITYYLFNESDLTSPQNTTTYTSLVDSINWSVATNVVYYYNVSVNDTVNNLNVTGLKKFTLDSVNPQINNLSGMVVDEAVGGASVLFNWTVSDNLDTNLSCYPTYTGSEENSTSLVYLANDSNYSQTLTLPGGQHTLNITCYDNANNTNQSEGIDYLVAIINVSSPLTSTTARINESSVFLVDEISGADFLNNASISLQNSSGEFVSLDTWGFSGARYTFESYTWNFSQPDTITVLSTGFNSSRGSFKNATDSITIYLLRPEGTTSAPVLTSAYPNTTYNLNNTQVQINLIADLDTLFYDDNLTVTDPDGMQYELSSDESSTDQSGFINYLNYTFEINKTGTYNISAVVEDYEYQNTSTWNYSFYSSANSETLTLNNTVNFSILDVGNEEVLFNGSDLQIVIPDNAIYDMKMNFSDSTKNLSFRFEEVNLTTNLSLVLNHTALTNETDAPSSRRRIALFDLNTEMNYTNYTFELDYSAVVHTMNNEESVNLYKCSNISNCVFSLVSSTLNSSANTLTSTSTDMSRFIFSEAGTTTVTETVTASSGGGGGGTTTVYADFEIITPGKATMELNDEIIIPVKLSNPFDSVVLNNLELSASPNVLGLSAKFDKTEITKLATGGEETINLIVKSENAPLGEYEIDINVSVGSPAIVETAKVFVRVVETLGEGFVRERIVLVKDLFKENPDCLEFNDYLLESEKILVVEPEKAKELVQYAIDGCRDLITSKEKAVQRITSVLREQKWKDPVMFSSILMILAILIVFVIMKIGSKNKGAKISVRESSPKKSKGFFSGMSFFKKSKSRSVAKKDAFAGV